MKPADPYSFTALLKYRRRHDYDTVIVLVGDEGEGKSAYAKTIIERLEPTWTPSDGLIFDWDDWDSRFDPAGYGRVYWLDEAINLAFNRNWNQTPNKRFMQLFRQNRFLKNTYILCLPAFNQLDRVFRESRTHYRIDIIRRGLAEVQYRTKNRFTETIAFHPAYREEYPAPDGPFWDRYKDEEIRKKTAILSDRHASVAGRPSTPTPDLTIKI